MKKLKNISFLLAITVLMTGLTIPFAASAAETVYLDENFDSYSSTADLDVIVGDTGTKWIAQRSGDAPAVSLGVGEGPDSSNAVKLTRTNSSETIERKLDTVITEGKIAFTFKIMSNYDNPNPEGEDKYHTTIVSFENGHNVSDRVQFLFIDNGEIYTCANNRTDSNKYLCDSVSQTWYDVEVVFDMSTKTYNIKISDENGVLASKTGLDGKFFGTSVLPQVDRIKINFWGGDNTAGYSTTTIDDIKVEDYIPPANPIIFEENFNGYASSAALTSNWVKSGATDAGCFGLGTGEDGTQAMTITRTGASEQIDAAFEQAINTGKFKFTFDLMCDYTDADGGDTAKQTTIVSLAYGSSIYLPVIYINNGKIYTGVNKADSSRYLCASVSKQWYDVEIDYDLNEGQYNVSVYDGTKVSKLTGIAASSFSSAVSMQTIDRIRLNSWDGVQGYGSYTLDNMKIQYSTQAIDVKATDLVFANASGENSNFATEISASTEKICVDFETVMHEATLDASTVVLKNEDTGVEISYEGELDGSIYTINLPRLLEPETNYSLTVTTSVKNVAGANPEAEAVFYFATDEGDSRLGFKGVKVGSNETPAIGDILAASSIDVSFDMVNSTGEDKNLLIIVAYYNGAELADVFYHAKALPYADYANQTVTETVAVQSGITADTVQIFVWDTIGGMKHYDSPMMFSYN